MSWTMDEHYRMDDGNFETLSEYERAIDNGDLRELSNGHYYDEESDTEYDYRGNRI